MSIEDITGKILSEAKNAAESSVNNANVQSLEIINEAKKEAESVIAEASNLSEIEAETIKKRKVSEAELQARKMLLSSKQEAIKKSFDMALKKLVEMPDEKYIDFLANQVSEIPYNEGTIILNKEDRKKIGQKLIKAVHEKTKSEKFTLSEDTVNAVGGFVLESGAIIINSTFETILDSVRNDITNEVANVLFK